MSKDNKKLPLVEIVIGVISLYFFYQAYSLYSIEKYFLAGFFFLVSIVLIVTAYFNYKNNDNKD